MTQVQAQDALMSRIKQQVAYPMRHCHVVQLYPSMEIGTKLPTWTLGDAMKHSEESINP